MNGHSPQPWPTPNKRPPVPIVDLPDEDQDDEQQTPPPPLQ